MSEITDLQNPCQHYLDDLGIKYLRIAKTTSHYYDWNKKLKGCPDLAALLNKGKVIFFEFKLKGNKLSKTQIEWRDYLLKNNYEYYIIYDIKDFIEIIKKNA